MRTTTLPLARLALLMGGVASAGLAAAQEQGRSPYYFGASQAFVHEDNLFREENNKQSDTISTTSLLFGLDQPISRQRLFVDGAVRYNKYRDNDQLDNTSYDLRAGVDWATVNRLSGTVSYAIGRSMQQFGERTIAGDYINSKNLQTSQQFLARVRLGGGSLLSLDASYQYRRIDYSASAYRNQEFDQNTVGFGVQYRPSGLLTLGAGIRVTRGEYKAQNDDFDRNDFDLTAIWTPSGLSTVSARLSYSKEEHDVETRDFSGVTGALSWDYKPTGKLSFTTDLIRDTGAESNFIVDSSTATGDYTNRSRVSDTIQTSARYQATGKIGVTGYLRYTDRDLGGEDGLSGSDKTTFARLGVDYAPTRTILVGLDYGYEKRTASGSSAPYTANTIGINARILFR